ncbi:hypothetical protein ABD91_20670 [Lysinibacillus sphaericus]|uniref:hypothetical protein n=1 Tax=Lysinibacillus sphaericus TaxID=1421 RepID=UPI0018CD25BA|nr:hypothetical protein [Lysinibacillus sphaericus]MBG9693157.1 hypothetical protein [Lysinibacillus sphaericus]
MATKAMVVKEFNQSKGDFDYIFITPGSLISVILDTESSGIFITTCEDYAGDNFFIKIGSFDISIAKKLAQYDRLEEALVDHPALLDEIEIDNETGFLVEHVVEAGSRFDHIYMTLRFDFSNKALAKWQRFITDLNFTPEVAEYTKEDYIIYGVVKVERKLLERACKTFLNQISIEEQASELNFYLACKMIFDQKVEVDVDPATLNFYHKNA